MRAAAQRAAPELECWLSDPEQGMFGLMAARSTPDGGAEVASFLLDAYCLGVKDASRRRLSRGEWRGRRLQLSRQSMRPASPALARRVLDEVVTYARSLGLDPHPAYERCLSVLAEVPPQPGPSPVVCGRGGKPVFVSHPDDDVGYCRRVVASLLRARGRDGFHYILLAHQATALEGLLAG